MNVAFVNRYTVTREDYKPYHHLDPVAASAPYLQSEGPAEPQRGRLAGNIVRIAGLCIAVAIIFVAVVGKMTVFIIVGLVLAGMYGMRIIQARNREEQRRQKPRPPKTFLPPVGAPGNDMESRGKWIRYIRFGQDSIEVMDPDEVRDYNYGQIERITDDPAYLTLWMNDHTQVRVSKKGFTVGTLQGFEQFIMARTNRMIGPGPQQN